MFEIVVRSDVLATECFGDHPMTQSAIDDLRSKLIGVPVYLKEPKIVNGVWRNEPDDLIGTVLSVDGGSVTVETDREITEPTTIKLSIVAVMDKNATIVEVCKAAGTWGAWLVWEG